VSGAGRALKENLLHAELSEGTNAYAIGGTHRHLGEFDQEFSLVAGRPVQVQFTPHLLPMNRGILATVYVQGDAAEIHATLAGAYMGEPFIEVLPFGQAPSTHEVRGSNFVHIGVCADRLEGRAIVFAALDNLTKGFKEGEGMVGTGNLVDGVFQASEILAKHDETYMPVEVIDALKEQGIYKEPNAADS